MTWVALLISCHGFTATDYLSGEKHLYSAQQTRRIHSHMGMSLCEPMESGRIIATLSLQEGAQKRRSPFPFII